VKRSLSRVARRLQGKPNIDDVLKNPNLLKGKHPDEVKDALKKDGWQVETLGKGSKKGQGYVLREYTPNGVPTGQQMRWHPGGGHHGPEPYWRVITNSGKSGTIR
jgi:hypothetical protein